MTITKELITDLRAKAEAARAVAPGAWRAMTLMVKTEFSRGVCHTGLGMVDPPKAHEQPRVATYIAAAQPATILALLDTCGEMDNRISDLEMAVQALAESLAEAGVTPCVGSMNPHEGDLGHALDLVPAARAGVERIVAARAGDPPVTPDPRVISGLCDCCSSSAANLTNVAPGGWFCPTCRAEIEGKATVLRHRVGDPVPRSVEVLADAPRMTMDVNDAGHITGLVGTIAEDPVSTVIATEHFAIINETRPTTSRLIFSDDALERAARAYDGEVSGQKGELSPWSFAEQNDDWNLFRAERLTAMRCALEAFFQTEPTERTA